jgi:hypothetical protein
MRGNELAREKGRGQRQAFAVYRGDRAKNVISSFESPRNVFTSLEGGIAPF